MRKKTFSTVLAIALSAAVLMLAGCGGSGGSAPPTVSGIAATGQAIVGNVRLKDSSSPSRELTVATGTDGSYVVNVAGLTPPFLVRADWTPVGGTQSLVSFAAGPGTANINPLSNAIVANAAGVTDPVALFDAPTPAMQNKIAAAIGTATSDLQNQLKPLLTAYGATIDPIRGAFAANHTGMDAMFDAVKITLVNGTLTVSNASAPIFTAPVTQFTSGVFTNANMPTASPITTPPAMDGAALYAANCAGCHGALAKSTKLGATVARIQSAIGADMGGMGSLAPLSSQEIQSIATALAPPATTPTPTTTTPSPIPAPPATADGAALYAGKCAGCHGPLATSTKQGITATRLQAAIKGNIGGMGSISLSAAEVQSIVNALAGSSTPAPTPAPAPAPTPAPSPTPTPAPVDGASLYATNCAGCHGALASSTKRGITLARLQAAISSNIGGMGALSSLTAAQQQAIVSALAVTAPTPAPTPTPAPAPAPTPAPTPAPIDGASLYAANCAGCHGALSSSTKQGITLARLQTAISSNIGGMGALSSLTAAQQQAIVSALAVTAPTPAPTPTPAPAPAPTPAPTPAPIDGASLYATNCANCHGILANSTKKGITLARLQTAISGNIGGMGVLSSLSSAEQQAIVNVLAVVTPPPTPAPTPTPAPVDGATLYSTKCAGCHGALATSTKQGITLARLDAAISGNIGGMGTLSTLTTAEKQAIVTALAVTAPTPAPAPTPTPTPTPAPVDGAALYTTSCAGCHGPLASSAKAGATASRIQTAINGNVGGMGSLSTLTATQVQAIATALATVTPPTTPPPTPACGSCHAIPPATGQHLRHLNQRVDCATCHGAGYSTTTVNAATHNNGVKNLTTTIGWNATTRTCSNSCHGTEQW